MTRDLRAPGNGVLHVVSVGTKIAPYGSDVCVRGLVKCIDVSLCDVHPTRVEKLFDGIRENLSLGSYIYTNRRRNAILSLSCSWARSEETSIPNITMMLYREPFLRDSSSSPVTLPSPSSKISRSLASSSSVKSSEYARPLSSSA